MTEAATPEDDDCPECGERVDACTCFAESDDDCYACDGEGIVPGDEIESHYDAGWIDPEQWYDCRNCGGTGKRKDMTIW